MIYYIYTQNIIHNKKSMEENLLEKEYKREIGIPSIKETECTS